MDSTLSFYPEALWARSLKLARGEGHTGVGMCNGQVQSHGTGVDRILMCWPGVRDIQGLVCVVGKSKAMELV